MPTKKDVKVSVAGTKIGVIVTGVTAAQVRRALALLKKQPARGAASSERRLADKFYRMSEKFFKSGGRFKKPYKRKPRATKPVKKTAKKSAAKK